MSKEGTVFIISSDNILVSKNAGMSIELGRIINIHTYIPRNEALHAFTLDNGICITLPHSRVFKSTQKGDISI